MPTAKEVADELVALCRAGKNIDAVEKLFSAEAVSVDGKVLYANRAFADLTSVQPGATLEEIVFRCRMRTFGGDAMDVADMPESRALSGETVSSMLVRMRPPGRVAAT